MSESLELKEKTRGQSLAKGLLAGLIGGLVATAAKTLAEKIYPPRTHGEPAPPEVLVEKLAGGELVSTKKQFATGAIYWGFGALTGAAYGAVVEYYPPASAKDGAGFGMALSSLTHDTVLPAIGLAADPEEQTARERTSEMATHVVYGVVTETVRRVVRKMLG
jgi:putative membrane protein